jgi:hypothetical protein
MRQFIPFVIAIGAVIFVMKVKISGHWLAGHYVLTHYDPKDLLLQIAWGLGLGGVCWLIAKIIWINGY